MKRPPPWAYTALQSAAAGVEFDIIATQLSKPLTAVKRLLNSDWAQEQLAAWNTAVMAGLANARVDPLIRFQSLVDKAIQKVEQKMDCGDDKVELAAAQRILDNAGLKPVTPIAVSEDESLRKLTPEQMEYVRRTGRMPASAATIAVAYTAGRLNAEDDAEAADLLD